LATGTRRAAGNHRSPDGATLGLMNALVIGCGRVGSSIALQLTGEGWDVTVVDENEEALSRLGDKWPGTFLVGHGMDTDLLREAGIEEADAVVVATDGDNTNIVIGQVAQNRFDVRCVVVRVLDPARADFYAARGLRTVCPTKTAIDVLLEAARSCAVTPQSLEVPS
jgi:trk system potassium uptake protein